MSNRDQMATNICQYEGSSFVSSGGMGEGELSRFLGARLLFSWTQLWSVHVSSIFETSTWAEGKNC